MSVPVLQYSESADREYPSITELPRIPLEEKTKQIVLDYMTNPDFITWRTFGVAPTSAFTGKMLHCNGNLLDDGVYYWGDDLPEYVRDWDIQLPSEFVEHVLSRSQI